MRSSETVHILSYMRAPYIVVVDDDDGMSIALKRLLKSEGYEVLAVSSGEDALGAMRTRRPDCVVMDIELPDYKDLELFESIADEHANLPVIAITAWVDDNLRGRFLSRGGHSFFYKPFSDHLLLEALRYAFEGKDRLGNTGGFSRFRGEGRL